MLVGDGDVVHIDRLAHQGAGLGIELVRLKKIRPHPRTEVLRLPDVDHLALSVLVEVAAGQRGERADFI